MIFRAIRKPIQDIGLKILTPKHIFKMLSMALAQLKVGNTSESLVIEI